MENHKFKSNMAVYVDDWKAPYHGMLMCETQRKFRNETINDANEMKGEID
jgi:hypothetical protein